MTKAKHTREEILCYRPEPRSRSTVRRKYAAWRQQRGIPVRCDIEHCAFHSEPLMWLGRNLPVILDHKNGNNLDNSPKNLRYLCPNCDAQLSTRGGANRGRVLEAEDGKFVLLERDGTKHYHVIPEPAHIRLEVTPPEVVVTNPKATKRKR